MKERKNVTQTEARLKISAICASGSERVKRYLGLLRINTLEEKSKVYRQKPKQQIDKDKTHRTPSVSFPFSIFIF
jgi:hypothetical protein